MHILALYLLTGYLYIDHFSTPIKFVAREMGTVAKKSEEEMEDLARGLALSLAPNLFSIFLLLLYLPILFVYLLYLTKKYAKQHK